MTNKATDLFYKFFSNEKAGGVLLLLATIVSISIANSDFSTDYIGFWNSEINGHSIVHWINDGLMAIFFLLIGLELEREIYKGELSNLKKAALPIIAAFGGMIIPAGLYLFFNYGTDTSSGAGIPMATDIAFAVGILSLLGSRVPLSLKIFLTALAVIDDLGAIVVIAVFYSQSIVLLNLFISLGIFGLLLLLNRLKVFNLIPYLIGGCFMWYFMLHSGVHATITGVLLAFAIPFGSGEKGTTSYVLQSFLHKPVAFVILPLFAIANTCIVIDINWQNFFREYISIGILTGLVIGKPLGIFMFSYLGERIGLCALPPDLKWRQLLATGFLGGIGFTMSIFITLLAFEDEVIVDTAKIAILVASLASAALGYFFLARTLR